MVTQSENNCVQLAVILGTGLGAEHTAVNVTYKRLMQAYILTRGRWRKHKQTHKVHIEKLLCMGQ